jgi:hypothetical protein
MGICELQFALSQKIIVCSKHLRRFSAGMAPQINLRDRTASDVPHEIKQTE